MSKILFLVPSDLLVSHVKEVLSPNYPDIEIALASPKDAAQVVQRFIAQGVEVVAARPVTALAIKEAGLGVNVVTIPITGFDIIKAINEAKMQGKRIALVVNKTLVLGIDFLAKELGVEIRHYAMSHGQDYEKVILQATAEGAEVILGGALAVTVARRHGIPCSLIQYASESILQAAQQAVEIQSALEVESAKRGFLSTILDHTRNGIITVDKDRKITAFNPVSEKLINIGKTAAIGQAIDDILPQIKFNKKGDLHSLINVHGNRIMCNSVPIMINSKSYGFVITLEEVSKIQQMEALIRKEIYASGHYAKFSFRDIIGNSPKITKAKETAAEYAATNSSVLILGESGTGKELFAQSIHNASKRAKEPFVAINCAALPAQILESELFGYVGGAFTGASKDGKPGLFEVAHGGTIFLDEITEMDYTNQGRLLRVLQEKAVVRLGSYKVIPVDVRVIAATNRDLEALVQQNAFRIDLFYRLNVLRLDIPSLRERKEDIANYADTFLQEFASGATFQIRPDALQFLLNYPWPGNIRELRNLMERLSVVAKTNIISGALLSELVNAKPLPDQIPRSPKELRMTQQILDALEKSAGNHRLAAEELGIDRSTLWRRMQRLKIVY